MDQSTLEANKKIARQTFEAFEKKDESLLEKITDTANFKLHFPGNPQPLNFQDAVKLNKEYSNAFPDTKVSITNQIAEGDLVCTQVVFEGTNKGEFQGHPASNKKVKASGISIHRIVNGKVVEEWDEFDALGMMVQIGAVPELTHP